MVLSSSLIVNTLNALLTQHRRQIGVMKLMGRAVPNFGHVHRLDHLLWPDRPGHRRPLGVISGYGLAVFMGDFMSVESRVFGSFPSPWSYR